MTTPPPEDDLSQVEPEDLKRLDYPSAFDWNAKGAVQKPNDMAIVGQIKSARACQWYCSSEMLKYDNCRAAQKRKDIVILGQLGSART